MLQSLELERVGHSNSTKSLLDRAVSGWQASLVAQRIKLATRETWVSPGLIPRSGRSPGEGNGNPLQYSSLENAMNGEACRLHSMGLQRVSTTDQPPLIRTVSGNLQVSDSYQKVSIGGALTPRSRKEHAAKEGNFCFTKQQI